LFHKIGKPQSQKAVSNGTLNYYGYAAKSAAMARQICQRLRFSRRQSDHISFIIRLHRRPYSLFQVRQKMGSSDRMFIRFFMKCGDAVPAILLLGLAEFIANTGGGDPAVAEFTDFVLARIRQFDTILRPRTQVPPALNGNDLIREFGLNPAADFKYILTRIQEEHLAGRDLMTRKEALELVQDLLDRIRR
jgi:hypothetical protein